MRWLAIVLMAALAFIVPASALGNGKSLKGKVEIEGVITTVAPQGGFIVVRDEKGRTWMVLVDLATEIKFEDDDDDHFRPATIRALRVGDEVEVKGLLLGDGRILALKIEVEEEEREARLQPLGTFIRAVVIVISNTTLVVITQDGTITVVIQPGTRLFKGDRRITLGALGRHDVVLVRGKSSSGRLLAEEVRVEFDATEGLILTGIVGTLWLQGGAFLLGGTPTWVNITSRTFIIQDRSPVTLTAIRPNGSVVVYGLGKGTAMQAVVIVVR